MFVIDRSRVETDEVQEEIVEMAGTTGNIYTVKIGLVPSCTCPDHLKGNQCKHIIYVWDSLVPRVHVTDDFSPGSPSCLEGPRAPPISACSPFICEKCTFHPLSESQNEILPLTMDRNSERSWRSRRNPQHRPKQRVRNRAIGRKSLATVLSASTSLTHPRKTSSTVRLLAATTSTASASSNGPRANPVKMFAVSTAGHCGRAMRRL